MGADRPDVTVEANVFTSLFRGLHICDQATADVGSNSFSGNTGAVIVSLDIIESGFVVVHDNCIAGNFLGMVAPQAVDARENWWGAPVGPRVSHNTPLGGGDILQGDAAPPWLLQDNCAPQVRDLHICNVEVTQAVQTYDNAVPLVAGKPALVRVYPGSATDALIPVNTKNALCLPENVADGGLGPLPLDPDQFWAGIDEYRQLLAHNQAAATARQLCTAANDPQTYVLVGGVVNQYGEAAFMPAWQVTTSTPPSNPPAGSAYCLELRDAGDAVLTSHCFDLPWPTEYWKRWQGFQIALPLTDTPSRVVLRMGSTELGSISVSASAPSVSLGESSVTALSADAALPLSWTAQDSDGDDLVYTVLYSADDGTTWLPVATNLTESRYTLDLAEVPGGTDAWIRVEASDGFHTASDTLGPFTVDDHSPLVAIVQPAAGSVVSPTLALLGYGYDHEDGELTGTSLVWSSDREGQLGTGSMVTVQDLLTGTHRLTLTATDARGHTATTSVRVGVETPVDPDDGPRIYLPLVLRR